MPNWQLSCLICGQYDTADLVAIQEHGMGAHEITREDLQRATRQGPIRLHPIGGNGPAMEMYTWALPDGRTWLRAIRPAQEG